MFVLPQIPGSARHYPHSNMNFDELNEENFIMYAIKHYDNPGCNGIVEFNDDLKRFKYLKRLFRKGTRGEELKERLILNHIIVLYNLFGNIAATRMLFYKIDQPHWAQLKTFLVFLNYMPEHVLHQGQIIPSSQISLDADLVELLRNI